MCTYVCMIVYVSVSLTLKCKLSVLKFMQSSSSNNYNNGHFVKSFILASTFFILLTITLNWCRPSSSIDDGDDVMYLHCCYYYTFLSILLHDVSHCCRPPSFQLCVSAFFSCNHSSVIKWTTICHCQHCDFISPRWLAGWSVCLSVAAALFCFVCNCCAIMKDYGVVVGDCSLDCWTYTHTRIHIYCLLMRITRGFNYFAVLLSLCHISCFYFQWFYIDLL